MSDAMGMSGCASCRNGAGVSARATAALERGKPWRARPTAVDVEHGAILFCHPVGALPSVTAMPARGIGGQAAARRVGSIEAARWNCGVPGGRVPAGVEVVM